MSTQQFKRTLVTTALPYANGPVHIGHLAGVYIPADIYVRYKRMKGDEVLFIGGSDEHGVPIAIKAKAEGVSPQEVVDRSPRYRLRHLFAHHLRDTREDGERILYQALRVGQANRADLGAILRP